MIVYHSLEEATGDRSRWPRAVATTGFFDGLHLGHRKLLEDLRAWGEEVDAAPVVVTFRRHPGEVLFGSGPPQLLGPRHRLVLLERSGIAVVAMLEFNADLARWSAREFVRRVLVEGLNARRLLLGFDSAVGHGRQGTFEYFSAHASELGIEVRQAAPLLVDGQRVSSTLVRQAVVAGDLERAKKWTGRPYSILGEVVGGAHRGKDLGFPTANLRVEVEAALPGGVYFAEVDRIPSPPSVVSGADKPPLRSRLALVNIGRRPTFAPPGEAPATAGATPPRFDPARDRVEVHILDFEEDLYGDFLEVHFLRLHRREQRFDSVEALVEQIRSDERAIRAFRRAQRERTG